MKKLLIVLLVLSVVLLVACGGGRESGEARVERIPLIYTHYQPGTADQPKQAAALAFQGYVERATNGVIQVQIYPNSELGDAPAVLQAMQAGTIQMTVVHDGPTSAFYPLMGMYSMPFLFETHAEAWTVFDSPFTERVGEAMRRDTGIRLLGFGDNGIRHMTNSRRPLVRLEDLRGLTMRIQPSPVYEAMMIALGANPTAISWTELPVALQQGVADGQDNGITNILAARLYETQRYTTMSGHVYGFHVYVIDDRFYSSLTASQQAAIRQGAELAKWVHRGMTSHQDNLAKSILQSHGVQVTELTPQELARWRAASQPAVVDWMNRTYGGTWVSELLAEVNKLR